MEKSCKEKLRGKEMKSEGGFRKWLSKNNIRAMVLGDSHLGFKLQSFLLNDESFEKFDFKSLIEKKYDPNLLIVVGPINKALQHRVNEVVSSLKSPKLIYMESLASPSDEESSIATGEKLKADFILAKEFITMENIKDTLARFENV